MSSISIILVIFINHIYQAITISQCHLLNAVDLQSATYNHSLILRVRPIYTPETIEKSMTISEVLVREVIKISINNYHQIKINDVIVIRIDDDIEDLLDDSCWYLLRMNAIESILFLNETNASEFDLRYPPIESTLYVRENIDAVLNYETYAPQVIIKTQMATAVLFNSYSLQCNVRGNPLPRLLWSKTNQTFGYFPSNKQCLPLCRIYSIQNEYESILYFQAFTNTDRGIYVCHAENAINYTMTSVYIDVDQTNIMNQSNLNVTCAILKYCHYHGQCILVNNRWKCLCENRFIGDECELNYDDIMNNQNNVILLYKSRLLNGSILFGIGCVIILIIIISCLYKRNKNKRRKYSVTLKPIENTATTKYDAGEPVNIHRNTEEFVEMPSLQIISHSATLKKQPTTMNKYNNDRRYSYDHSPSTRQMRPYSSLQINHQMKRSTFKTTANRSIHCDNYENSNRSDMNSRLIRPSTLKTNISKSSDNHNSSRHVN